MNFKYSVLLLALISFASAAPTENDAQQAFVKMVQKFDFRPEPFRKRYKDDGMFIPPYVIESVVCEKNYVEDYRGEKWTVFPTTGVVSTSYGRYSVKVGVGLIEKGDQFMMREAVAHEIGEAPPPSQKKREEASSSDAKKARLPNESSFDYMLRTGQKEEQPPDESVEKKNAFRKQAESRIAEAFKTRKLALPSNLKLKASVNQRPVGISSLEPISVQVLRTQGSGAYEQVSAQANLSLTVDELGNTLAALAKWKEWSATAKQNKVVSFDKDVATIGQSGEKLALHVGNTGEVFLAVDAGSNGFVGISEAEVGSLSHFLEKLAEDLATAQKKVEEVAAQTAGDADNKAALFK